MTPTIARADLQQDRSALIAFLKANVNARMRDEAYDWQYLRGLGPVIFNVARAEGQVVCSQSFLSFPMRRDGDVIDTAKSENSFLAKQFRGTPLFQDVYAKGVAECFANGMPAVWGYTPAAKVWRDRLGFHVEEERMWHCIVPIGTPASPGLKAGPRAWASRALTAARAALVRTAVRKHARAVGSAGLQVLERPLRSDDVNQLLARMGGAGAFHLDMSERCLSWRVWDNPNLHYTGAFIYRNGELVGYALISFKRDGGSPTAQLADLVFQDEAIGWLLLDRAVKAGMAKGCTWMRYFGNRSNIICRSAFELLGKLQGARSMPDKGMAFVVKSDTDFPHTDYDQWYMNGLWTEGYSV